MRRLGKLFACGSEEFHVALGEFRIGVDDPVDRLLERVSDSRGYVIHGRRVFDGFDGAAKRMTRMTDMVPLASDDNDDGPLSRAERRAFFTEPSTDFCAG